MATLKGVNEMINYPPTENSEVIYNIKTKFYQMFISGQKIQGNVFFIKPSDFINFTNLISRINLN